MYDQTFCVGFYKNKQIPKIIVNVDSKRNLPISFSIHWLKADKLSFLTQWSHIIEVMSISIVY